MKEQVGDDLFTFLIFSRREYKKRAVTTSGFTLHPEPWGHRQLGSWQLGSNFSGCEGSKEDSPEHVGDDVVPSLAAAAFPRNPELQPPQPSLVHGCETTAPCHVMSHSLPTRSGWTVWPSF
eukprot:349878-Chlamydomonas_euryale.AAC.9